MVTTKISPGLVACVLAMVPGAVVAQSVRVIARSPVILDLPGRPLGEPHLAIHPDDASHLLGAAMVHDASASRTDSTRSRIRCAAMRSRDNGATWAYHLFDVRECFDPQVVFTPGGRAVLTVLGVDPAVPERADALLVLNSTDGGETWSTPPLSLGNGHDRPILVADRSDPDRENWVYVASSLMARADNAVLRFGVAVARSRNGARSFDPMVFLRPTTLMALAETPVVLSDGNLIVTYVEPARGDGRTKLPRRRAWVMESQDGGFEFGRPRYVNEACGSDTSAFSLSFLAADASDDRFRDRFYFACNQEGPSNVVVSTSDDRGESWTAPRPVDFAARDSTVRRKVMATAINSGGVVGVVWVESGRNDAGPCADDVYFTASVDGGETFFPAELIASPASCATPELNGSGFPGDYFGLATDTDGRFRLLWSGVRRGLLQLHSATIEVDGSGPTSRPQHHRDDATRFSFKVVRAGPRRSPATRP